MGIRRQAAALAALCCLLYLPGLGAVEFYTRGEAREALAVREVVRTDHWLVPMRPDGRLTRKPPLFYWAGGAVWRLVPESPEWAVRLPSAIAATVGVLATALLGHAALGPGAALAALVLATSFEWVRAATAARVDMLLVAGTTLILLAWTRQLAGSPARGTGLLAALGATIAILAKGPVGVGVPAVALVATAVATRRAALLRLLAPLAAGAAIAALWYLAAWLAHGRAFVDIVMAENLGRFVDPVKSRTGHAHGPLYLVPIALLALLPWTPVLPLAAVRGTAPGAVRTLAAAWIATLATVVLLSASKRQVYLLPLVPAVAMLLADGLAGTPSARLARTVRLATWVYAPIMLALGLAVISMAAGAVPATLASRVLAPPDALLAGAILDAVRGLPFAALGALTAGAGIAVARARAAHAWRRLVLVVAGLVATWVPAFQLLVHPAIARTRGVEAFLRGAAPLVPPATQVFAIFPVDPVVRFYAPWPLERWQRRPPDRDVLLLAWEREAARLHAPPDRPIVPLATGAGGAGRRGRLVLLRVPQGAVPPPPRRAQNG